MIDLEEMPNGAYYCQSDPGEPGTNVRRISVTPMEGRFIRHLARQQTVLEIGTGLGVSTEFLVSTARKLITLDIDPWVKEYVWPNLPKGCEMINHRDGLRDHERFTMVFIDGAHDTDSTIADIDFAKEVVDRGLIVLHDMKIPEVREATDSSWAFVETHHGIGVKYWGWEEE